tara:strand:+ start:285 stop:770 length:486 start_codon:yes stop_codon:yes gene_type:complete
MSFRNLMPLASSALQYAQAGSVFIQKDSLDLTGHAGGFSGSGTQSYLEILAGDECGSYTSADNTTGTLYYPEIKYFTAIKGYGLNTLNGNLMELETSAKSLTRDHLAKNATYEPDASGVSQYIMIFHGDEIFGKFARFALYKTSAPVVAGRYLLTKGPANN